MTKNQMIHDMVETISIVDKFGPVKLSMFQKIKIVQKIKVERDVKPDEIPIKILDQFEKF